MVTRCFHFPRIAAELMVASAIVLFYEINDQENEKKKKREKHKTGRHGEREKSSLF